VAAIAEVARFIWIVPKKP